MKEVFVVLGFGGLDWERGEGGLNDQNQQSYVNLKYAYRVQILRNKKRKKKRILNACAPHSVRWWWCEGGGLHSSVCLCGECVCGVRI